MRAVSARSDVVNLLEWFLKANVKELQEAALAYERSKRTGASISVQEAHRAALESLAGDGPC
jgi:hypothetical protein